MTPWLLRLEKEWADGCRNGAEFWRRLRAGGFQGSLRVIGEWATRQRQAKQAVSTSIKKSLPTRKIARLLTIGRDHLSKTDAIQVARIEAALPALTQAQTLTDRFTDMVRDAHDGALDAWLEDAEETLLGAFASGLRQDQAAVPAGLPEPWSNGQTEGQINRIKIIKRQMYGGANINLLKAASLQRPEKDVPDHSSLLQGVLRWIPQLTDAGLHALA